MQLPFASLIRFKVKELLNEADVRTRYRSGSSNIRKSRVKRVPLVNY